MITVGTKGPGATARPSCSATTSTSDRVKPGAAEFLGEMDPEQAEAGQLGPEARQPLLIGLEQAARDGAGLMLGEEVGDGLREHAVIFGYSNRHG